eukprot:4028906-Amphidinium_carterae.1
MMKAHRLNGAKANMKRCDDALRSFMGVQRHTRRPQVNVAGRCDRVCARVFTATSTGSGRVDSLGNKESTAVAFAKLANGNQPVANELKDEEENPLPWEEGFLALEF